MEADPRAARLCRRSCGTCRVAAGAHTGERHSRRQRHAESGSQRGGFMTGLLAVFRGEFQRIFALRPVFSVVVVGSVFYAVFYPQPYLNEALRNVPIARSMRAGFSAFW